MRKEEGLFLNHSQEQAMLAEMNPLQAVQHTEFLQHLNGSDERFEKFWVNTVRDWLFDGFPMRGTKWLVVWGRTGVGKKLLRSNILFLANEDPILQAQLKERNLGLKKVTTAFSSSATLARLRGDIDSSHGHGQYTDEEYRRASIVHTEYTIGREMNNFEGPTLVVTEPSGPAVVFHPDGTMEGTDRANSTVYYLGRNYREDTKIIVITRGVGLEEQITLTRDALLAASPEEIIQVLETSGQTIYENGEPIDLKKLSRSQLIGLQRHLLAGMAPSSGVKRSNMQTDQLMAKYGISDEAEFWAKYLSDLRFTASDYLILPNPLTKREFPLHEDLLTRYDTMQPEIEAREELLVLRKQLTSISVGASSSRVGNLVDCVRSIPRRVINLFYAAAA